MERALRLILRICYFCKLCRVRFFKKRSMERHLPKCMKEHHERILSRKKSDSILNVKNKNPRLTYGNKLLKCQSLQSEEASQSRTNSYICSVCEKPFSSAEQLREHLRSHLTSFICKACGRSFTRAYTLKHHSSFYCKKRYVMCQVCNNIFVGVDKLREHCQVHFNDPEYTCGVCGEKHRRQMCFKNKSKGKSKLKVSLAGNSPNKGVASPAILQEVTYPQGDLLSNVNPGTSQDNEFLVRESSSVKVNSVVASDKPSLPIAYAIPRDAWKGVTLRESSSTDNVDHQTVSLKGSSKRLSSSMKATYPQTSQEHASKDIQPQNDITEVGDYVDPETVEKPPCITINQGVIHEGPSLETSLSTSVAIHPSVLEYSSSTNSPLTMTGNPEPFLRGISLKGLPSVIETAYPRIYQEGLTQDRPPSQMEILEKDTSLKCETLKLPPSVAEVDNQSAYLKGLSLETPFLTGPVDHPPILAPSSLKSPSQSKNDNLEVSSEEFSSLINIPNPRISHESMLYEMPSLIEISKIGSYPEHENLGAPSSMDEKDNSGASSVGSSSFTTSFSTKVTNPSSALDGPSSNSLFYSMRDNHEVCREGKFQVSTSSIDNPWITFAKDSELETSLPFAMSPSHHESASEDIFTKRTFEKKYLSSEINNSSRFSENNLPNDYMALDLPADMYRSGINLQSYDISRVFEDIEMNEIPSAICEDNTGTVVNEGDYVFPQRGHAMKPEDGNEVIDHKYGAEYNASEMNSKLDLGNENAEDYYLDNFDLLKRLYE